MSKALCCLQPIMVIAKPCGTMKEMSFHTLRNLVPIVLRDFGDNLDEDVKMKNGCLADIAPTILEICKSNNQTR